MLSHNKLASASFASARKLMKYDYWSAQASCSRLKRLQSILENDEDKLVCIQGIDSRFNEGMQECINYLFFQLFDYHNQTLNRFGLEDEAIDDLILCISKDEVHVYCHPLCYSYLLPYIASWEGIQIHCLTEEEYVDEDVLEEFKIKSFVAMLSGSKSIAVPYFSSNQVNLSFDKMKLEQWPLIQAYALEGYGRGTFFTLQHDVYDVSSAMRKIHYCLDVVSAERFITQDVSLFEKQWSGMVRTFDVSRCNQFKNLNENTAAESLTTYFLHGNLGKLDEPADIRRTFRKPFLYFGDHTAKLGNTFEAEKNKNLMLTSASSDAISHHMVCHGCAPKSHLSCTRTYFFGSSCLPGFSDFSAGDKVCKVKNQSVEQLSRAYREAVEGVIAGIKEYSTTLLASKVIAQTAKNIKSKLSKYMDCQRMSIDVSLTTEDECGRIVNIQDKTTPLSVNNFSASICGIYSTLQPLINLGGVSYSDSFLLSSIRTKEETSPHCDYVIITSNIPTWLTWNVDPNIESLTTLINQFTSASSPVTQYGKVLIDGESIELLSPQQWLQGISANLHAYENGCIFTNDTVGPIALHGKDIKSVEFFDGDSPSIPALAIFYTSLEFQSQLPLQMQNSARAVILNFTPRSKAYKLFFEKVFKRWKVPESNISLTLIKEPPAAFKHIYDMALSRFQIEVSGSLGRATTLEARQSSMARLKSFMDHLEASSCLQGHEVMRDDIPILLKHPHISERHSAGEDNSDICIIVTVLAGIPGSYKENLGNYITKLTQEKSRWVIHKQTVETSGEFDKTKLESTLAYIYAMLKKKQNVSSKTSRMMVITPGFSDLLTVLQTILYHPNTDVRRHTKIGAVTTCVNPLNTFISGRFVIPELLNQCAEGWVNNVVLTSLTEAKNKLLVMVQDLIRAANPNVAFILAEKGELTRSPDIDLILSNTAFSSTKLLRARILRSSEVWYGSSIRQKRDLVQSLTLRFAQPLVRHNFVSMLRGLKGRLTDYPFNHFILHLCGILTFSGNDEQCEVAYTVQSNLTNISTLEKKNDGTSFVLFYGFSLQESDLKDLLRRCAIQVPKKKVLLTKEALSKATLAKIHERKHLEPLPPGWFYNGTHYMDMMGEKSNYHPEFERFITEYLLEENQNIETHNKEVDAMHCTDLFA